MNKLLLSVSLFVLLPTQFVHADANRKECIGRLTFDVSENIQWATFNSDYAHRITDGGGQGFSTHVGALGDNASYNGVVIYVSDTVERSIFELTAGYKYGENRRYKEELKKNLASEHRLLKRLPTLGYGPEAITKQETSIKKLEHDISNTGVYKHDLGISDAYFLGSKDIIFDVLLWRKNRVYYFAFGGDDKDKTQHIKDLIARFEPRDLYQVPEGPGFCFPYGFIHDDGKTKYSIKNSLRFTREPNVIFTILNASAGDPYMKATSGTYNTDYRPGYDRENWEKTAFVEPLYFDRRLAGMDGWRLDPKPGSTEKERAWFGLAKTGGLTTPLIAVQAKTFKQGTDDLTGLTPPPEVLMPSLKALTKSMKQTLGE